jgi:hypothetical protein
MHCIGTRSGRSVRSHRSYCCRMFIATLPVRRSHDPAEGHACIFLTVYDNYIRNIFIFHGHTNRTSTPGVGRADISAMTAVHVVRCEIVAPFVRTLSLSRRTYNTHIQTFRITAYGPGRADISASTAVFHIGGQIAAKSTTESLSPLTTLSIDTRLS